MTIPAILPFPANGEADFETKADACVASINPAIEGMNAAASALDLNDVLDTSASSVAIGLGSKNFVVSPNKSFRGGQYLTMADAAAPAVNSMVAQVNTYNIGTGALVVNVISFVGSGTKTSWIISLSANLSVSPAMAGVVNAATTAEASTLLGVRKSNRKNQIINGNFAVDIRNKGVAKVLTAGAAPVYTVDRFYASCTGANASVQQVAVGLEKRLLLSGGVGCTGIKVGTRLIAENTGNFEGSNCTLSIGVSGPSFTLNWEAYAPAGVGANNFGTLAAPSRTLVASGSFNVVRTNDAEQRYWANLSLGNKIANGFNLTPLHLWGAINIEFTAVGANVSNSAIFLGDAQLESGGTPTAFDDVDLQKNIQDCEFYTRRIKTFARGPATAASNYFESPVYFPTMYKAPDHSYVAATGSMQNAATPDLFGLDASSGRFSITAVAAGDCFALGREYLLDAEV